MTALRQISGRFWCFYVLILLVAALLCTWGWHLDRQVTHEGRLIENTKAALLGLAAFYHLLRLAQLPNRQLIDVDVRIALALLCVALMVREVDIDRIGTSLWWAWAEDAIRVLVGLAVLGWYGYLLTKFKLLWQMKGRLIHTSVVLLSAIGCLWYIGAWPFDKMLVLDDATFSALIEIILELFATITLCLAAWSSDPVRID